ncbi:MAG TPA: hypothetical protein VFS78_16750 [Vicinamibacteria bacterium]|nr:hypothetical protein [Vicinamibacteria bacterium]
MTMSRWTWTALAFLAFVPSAIAQDPSPTAPEAPARTQSSADARDPGRGTSPTPLRVQVVFSKYQGEAKVGSLPYTLTCNAGERSPALLRMGIEVPVPVPMGPLKENTTVFQSIQYKNVGTSIDCRAGLAAADGRFRLELNIEQSSIYSTVDEKVRRAGGDGRAPSVTEGGAGGVPMFRTFKATFAPTLRDGQTVQYTAATDPVSGEVVKIDVTVNVVK